MYSLTISSPSTRMARSRGATSAPSCRPAFLPKTLTSWRRGSSTCTTPTGTAVSPSRSSWSSCTSCPTELHSRIWDKSIACEYERRLDMLGLYDDHFRTNLCDRNINYLMYHVSHETVKATNKKVLVFLDSPSCVCMYVCMWCLFHSRLCSKGHKNKLDIVNKISSVSTTCNSRSFLILFRSYQGSFSSFGSLGRVRRWFIFVVWCVLLLVPFPLPIHFVGCRIWFFSSPGRSSPRSWPLLPARPPSWGQPGSKEREEKWVSGGSI